MKQGKLLLEIGDYFQGKDLDENTNQVYNEQLQDNREQQEDESGEK